MQNLIVPEIAPLEYCGQKVLTINQISVLFKCKGSTIRVAFSRHRKNFVENEDYFYLDCEQLAEFKATNRHYTNVIHKCNAPFSNLTSNLYLWTKSGVEKLAKFIGTDEAKLIYSAVQQMYFTSVTPPENNFEKAKLLIHAAELTDDKSLRDELIQAAFCLIV